MLGVHHISKLPQESAIVRWRSLARTDRGIQRYGRHSDVLAGLLPGGHVALVFVFQQLPGHGVEGFCY